MYYDGKFVKNDRAEAAKYFQMSAVQGHIKSQLFLGGLYEKGKGVKKDLAEAAKWYGKAAEQGDAEAIRKLSKLKKSGF
jgi:TPR repeat protein